MFDKDDFLARIRDLRAAKGISERDYSDRSLEMMQVMLSDRQNRPDDHGLALESVIIAADILGVSTDYLLGRTDVP